jgi:ATP-dependent DNA ligase
MQPRTSRFGSPLVLSRVHWVRPELVAEVKYLTWTEDNLLRQVVYEGLREDRPAAEVRRPPPHPKQAEPTRPAARSSFRLTGAAALPDGLHFMTGRTIAHSREPA